MAAWRYPASHRMTRPRSRAGGQLEEHEFSGRPQDPSDLLDRLVLFLDMVERDDGRDPIERRVRER